MKIDLFFKLQVLLLLFIPLSGFAQDTTDNDNVIYIQPLFDYPVAPDSLAGLPEKSTYVVSHFWDKMDFSSNKAVDQTALNHAFEVFVSPMRWSDETVNKKVIADLLKNLQKNPTLSYQFTKAAELSLYSDKAIFWNDELYIRFIDNLLKNKKIPETRKERFKRQKVLLENSLIGNTPQKIDYIDINGKPSQFVPDGCITVIEFGDPACDDCRLAKLKMESDYQFSKLVDKGVISVLFIIPDAEEGWQDNFSYVSPRWHIGSSDSVADIYDLRTSPSFYVINGKGKIVAKNVTYNVAMKLAIEEAENKN